MFCVKNCKSPQRTWRNLALAIIQIALALYIATSMVPARADDAVTGNWHGQVQSPAGPLTVIVTLERAEDETLRRTVTRRSWITSRFLSWPTT